MIIQLKKYKIPLNWSGNPYIEIYGEPCKNGWDMEATPIETSERTNCYNTAVKLNSIYKTATAVIISNRHFGSSMSDLAFDIKTFEFIPYGSDFTTENDKVVFYLRDQYPSHCSYSPNFDSANVALLCINDEEIQLELLQPHLFTNGETKSIGEADTFKKQKLI